MEQTAPKQESDWSEIRDVLDETVGELTDSDRRALLLRYFEARPFAEIGSALGLSENAARMRVDRAVDKLRTRLAIRGITSTTAALASALGQFAVVTAPEELAAQTVSRAIQLAKSSTAGIPARAISRVAQLAGITVIAVAVLLLVSSRKSQPLPPTASGTVAAQNSLPASPSPADTAVQNQQSLASKSSQPTGLELFFVDAQTRTAITNRVIGLRGWQQGFFTMVDVQVELHEGRCISPFQRLPDRSYSILTHIESYADVRMRWKLDEADELPVSHIVQLVRPKRIGGLVEDQSGHPVARAKIGFNTEELSAPGLFTEDHCVDYLVTETDANGRWQIDRLAPEMVGRIFGGASHPDYSNSEMISLSRKPELLEAALQQNLILRLGEGLVVRGSVTDTNQQPLAGVTVRAGQPSTSRTREALTDANGTFEIRGCTLGDGILTGEKEGFAPVAIPIQVKSNMPPAQLTLSEGKPLRLRLIDNTGSPVTDARLILQSFPHSEKPPTPQIEFRRKADPEGRIVWLNAPEQNFRLTASADGFQLKDFVIQPDGQEHDIQLQRALIITGTVRDSVSGELLPNFRLGIGMPDKNSGQPYWSTLDRFWINFGRGNFRHVVAEAVMSGEENPRYIFRFEAEGHAPFVTRAYRADEGEVQVDVTLNPSKDIQAVVYGPDSKPAANVQVCLLAAGVEARLAPGGFDGALGNALSWLRRSDNQGWFKVPTGQKIDAIVLSSPSGYAETTIEELRKAGAVQLIPWARIEGTVQSGDLPLAKARLTLLLRSPRALLPLDFETTSDDTGHFLFPKAPPALLSIYWQDNTQSHELTTIDPRKATGELVMLNTEVAKEK
jgi:hypothetical protein